MTTDERLNWIEGRLPHDGIGTVQASWLIAELRRAREALREIRDTNCRAGLCEKTAKRGLGEP
jgi:hypothetical protein